MAIRIHTLQWTDCSIGDIARAARAAIAEFGIVRVSHFPASVHEYRNFLEMFGDPLGYYGNDAGTHPEDDAIWRIKYDPVAAASGETHAIAGPLAPHSSQSLRDPRPNFFSMLMVNEGWQSRPFGKNGESVLTPWHMAFGDMRLELGERFDQMRDILLDQIEFPDGCFRPVAYELEGASSEDDLGVRLKSNQLEYLQDRAPKDPATLAVAALAASAARTSLQVQLHSGDLMLLDNNRWGHGRASVVGFERSQDGELLLNPRELWSVTID